jgi:ABC-2 type transport system permease protein
MFFLQLRNELWKLFGKKRTYIGFGAFLVVQNVVLLAFHYSHAQQETASILQGNGYVPEQFISALTVAVIMLFPQIALLMPLYACLVGGDMVAKEAEDGTLRMILSRPVSRLRLLGVKWVAGMIFCVVLVGSLGVMAVGFARLWFPWGGLFVFIPEHFGVQAFAVLPADGGLRLYAIAHLILAVNACTMFGLAFMFSCFNMKPAAATILGLSFLLVCAVMEALPFFGEYKDWLLTHHIRCWVRVFNQPIPWPAILASLSVILGFNLTSFIVGATGFHLRDIKS